MGNRLLPSPASVSCYLSGGLVSTSSAALFFMYLYSLLSSVLPFPYPSRRSQKRKATTEDEDEDEGVEHVPLLSMASEKQAQEARFAEYKDGASLGAATSGAPDEKGSSGYAASEAGLDHIAGLHAQERRVLRKLDCVILPLTAGLYLSAYLDRGNLGNAKLQGLYTNILNSSDTQYSVCLTMFFVTYILFSIPGTLLAKAWLPSSSIALGCFIWSVAVTGMAGVTNFAGVIVCRLFIGLGEALFGQSVALLFSLFYRKDEIAKRLGLFIGAGVLSGAFSGLLAYGTAHIHGFAGVNTFRYLFLIEGIPSLVLSVAVFFCLPSRPDRTKFLREDERTIVITRLNRDSLAEGHTGIDWGGVRRALTDWRMWVTSIMYSAMNLTLGSVSGFLPTIIATLGYSNADAQLYSVPPYAVALVFMVSLCAISDRYQTRGICVAFVFLVSSIGWIILLAVVDNQHARYGATFCIVIGGYAAIPLIMSWVSNNCGSQSQRATALGMLNSVGQCLSILAAFLFPKSEGPRWIKGFSTNLAFNCLAITLALGMSAYYRYENRRRDRVEGGRPPSGTVLNVIEEHDLAQGFRYVP